MHSRVAVLFFASESRFLSSPIMIRVPFFLLLGFNKGTLNQKGQKGTTQKPRSADLRNTTSGGHGVGLWNAAET